VTVFKLTLKRNAFKQAKLNRSDLTLPSYCFIELNLRNSESSAFRGIAPDYEIELNL
jgi:carbamoylphosphate synthase large subunit